ncbi:MAG: DUF1801 domain-containing protein [Ignavibacterium sp.]|jgi:uncharacterized protein YdhG (YjbR/CyaY superfamily)|nr:DUF1801 domain-containing protein [Ignavibacterium sp.]
MKINLKEIKTIDDYINQFPDEIKSTLKSIRTTIKKAAPKATEVISYGMPAFKQNKVLVYFAVSKNHIGFYPTPNPIKIFSKELDTFKTSKGAIQFPLDRKIPLALISKITKFRVREDLELLQKHKAGKKKN